MRPPMKRGGLIEFPSSAIEIVADAGSPTSHFVLRRKFADAIDIFDVKELSIPRLVTEKRRRLGINSHGDLCSLGCARSISHVLIEECNNIGLPRLMNSISGRLGIKFASQI